MASLGDRRAASCEQHWNVVAGGVHQPADGVGGTDGNMDHDSRRLAAGAVVTMRHCHRNVLVRNGKEARILGAIAAMAADRLDDRSEIGARIGKYVVNTALAEPRQVSFGGHFLGGFVTHGLMSLLDRSATVEHVPFRWKRDMLQPSAGTNASCVRMLSMKPPLRPESTAVSGKFDRKMTCGVYECPITSDRAPGHIQARRSGWKPHVWTPDFSTILLKGLTDLSSLLEAGPLRASQSGHRPPERARRCRWGFSAGPRLLGYCPAVGWASMY